MKLNTKVVTGSVKLNYVNIKEARSNQLSSEPKYSITIIIPKESNTMDKIYEGIYNATKNGFDDAMERVARAHELGAPMTLINRVNDLEECKKVL